MARYREDTLLIGGRLVAIERGSFRTSKVKLAARWGCCKKTVERLLKLLENDGMIEQKTDNFGTTLKALNYNDYQDFSKVDAPQKKEVNTDNTKKEKKTSSAVAAVPPVVLDVDILSENANISPQKVNILDENVCSLKSASDLDGR